MMPRLPGSTRTDPLLPSSALFRSGVGPLFLILHLLTQDQAVVGGIDAHIVAGGVDAFDAVDVDAEDLAAILDVDHLLIAVGGMRVGGGFALELLGRFGRHLRQHALEPFALEIGSASCTDSVCQYV